MTGVPAVAPAVALATAAVMGAMRPSGASPAWGIALGGLAAVLGSRKGRWAVPMALVGLVVLTSALSGRAWAGLEPRPVAAEAASMVLVGDPVVRPDRSLEVVVRHEGDRLLARIAGDTPGRRQVAAQLSGERRWLSGTVVPMPPGRPDLSVRHVSGLLRVEAVGAASPATPPWSWANALRRTLVRGSASLDGGHRSLFTGLVIGDDRAQPPELADDFRVAGLSHLLAVSGQNVAFVLLVLAPVRRRIPLALRVVLDATALALFALVTRLEPSVLRATAMAAIAVGASISGHRVPGLEALALAVGALVVIDPLLVHSVGFRLSVAASAGILLLTPALIERIPGPGLLVQPMALTIAAQVAVAPLLIGSFGGVSATATGANLLAGPLAGFVMAWGLVGGLLAGVVEGMLPGLAAVIHAPTELALTGIDWVARRAAALPLRPLGAVQMAVVVGCGLVVAFRPRRVIAVLASVALVLVIGWPAPGEGPEAVTRPSAGLEVLRPVGTEATIVRLGARAWPSTVLTALRSGRVRGIDALVLLSEEPAAVAAAEAVRRRYRPRLNLAPDRVVDVRTVSARHWRPLAEGDRVVVGGVVLLADGNGVRVSRRRPRPGANADGTAVRR